MENETKENYWEQIQELLAETLGCGDIVSLSRWNDSNSISADISLSSNLLKNTIHEVNDNVELIHYTSLSSLFEIINSKKLRFGNASQMNDPKELSFFLKSLNNEAITEYKEQQKNIFVVSFCEYDSKANDKGEHFSMWRNYGENGNGVGIVFKVANKNLQSNWLDYALGKVDYNLENKSFENIKKYFALLEKFKSENRFIVNNIPKIIYMLAALNKAAIWSEEKEIRLLRHIKWEELKWSYSFNSGDLTKNVKATYVNGVVRYFTELDLDNRIRVEESKKNLK